MNERRSPRRRARSAPKLVADLAALRLEFGPGAGPSKRRLVAALAAATFASPADLVTFHELLLFLVAYPDDSATRRAAERALAGFSRRRDLGRHREALADSGIAGTALHYPYFWGTARRLAWRFPGSLEIDFERHDDGELAALGALVLAVAPAAESAWIREEAPTPAAALARLAGAGRTRAEALLESIAALPGDDLTREATHDAVLPFYRLASGSGTPSRTTARAAGSTVVFRRTPPPRGRPDLLAELRRPPTRIEEVEGRAAEGLVELARDAMACRARDLDCFCFGDPRDVRRFRHEDGLEFVAIGSAPERRLPLASAYGLLTLRNGVPTGYVQLDGFLRTALVHFNTFDTYRGADAAWVFARALATARALFGAEAFAIEPYQIGRDNDEAIASGAFWFYEKLGFMPLSPAVARLADAERERFRRRPTARSSEAILRRLADTYLVLEPFGRSATVPPHAAIARAATATLAADPRPRREAIAAQAEAVAAHLAFRPRGDDERLWLERWAPWLVALPGWARWSPSDRAAVALLLREKATRRESELPDRMLAPPRFAPALLELATRHGWERDLRGGPQR